MSFFSWMPGQTRSALLCACLVSLQLVGCASIVPQRADKLVDDANQALGPAQSSFAIEGRLLFKQGRRNDHLRFTWDHNEIEARDALMLTAALGQGVARITREENAAQLELADGKKFAGRDWQALSQQVFGQALPLDELPQWLRGAHPHWTGEKDGWKIAVTQAQRVKFKCSDTTAYPLRGTSGLAASLCHQHQLAQVTSALVPRRIEFSKDDISLSIIIETWGDDE